jgi:hypothetical protein
MTIFNNIDLLKGFLSEQTGLWGFWHGICFYQCYPLDE